MTHKNSTAARTAQRVHPVTPLMAIIAAILLIQIWSITLAVEEHFTARAQMAWAGFGASLFCVAVNLCLLKYLYALVRKKE